MFTPDDVERLLKLQQRVFEIQNAAKQMNKQIAEVAKIADGSEKLHVAQQLRGEQQEYEKELAAIVVELNAIGARSGK